MNLKKITLLAFVFAASVSLSSCTTNKKKKCDTCPKWTQQTEQPNMDTAS